MRGGDLRLLLPISKGQGEEEALGGTFHGGFVFPSRGALILKFIFKCKPNFALRVLL
jgi:hypothetical protein